MKTKYWVMLLMCGTVLTGCGVASNPTVCTDAPQSEWVNQDVFQANLLAEGYQINKFKVTEGQCYEIYGTNADGNKVEIYFNPVDSSIVKQETH
jgi:hypothetical protein